MKKIIILGWLFISFAGYSQKLNRVGKIVIDELPKAPDHEIIKENNKFRIYKDSLIFDGNVLYKLPDGYIANDETADDNPDRMNYYDLTGNLKVSLISPRIINFKVSGNGNFAAFYNQQNILLVNLKNFSIDTLNGSHSFAFTSDEKLIYFDSRERIIVYDNHVYTSNEFPVMFLDFNSAILVITSEKIMKLTDSGFVTVREFYGTFYDAMVIDNILYFVDKTSKRKDTNYRLFKTSDLVNYVIVEMLDYM